MDKGSERNEMYIEALGVWSNLFDHKAEMHKMTFYFFSNPKSESEK